MEVSGRINTQKCTEKSCMADKGDSKLRVHCFLLQSREEVAKHTVTVFKS